MSEFILPESNVLVDPINEDECSSLANNTGLDLSDGETTCQALQNRLLPLISQIIGDISSGTMTIYANEDSKCSELDKNPTLASMMSRIYRVSQAFTCILCQYDPTLSNLLVSGSYPQILMGTPEGAQYPVWVNPDTNPVQGSMRPITSGGVFNAINAAILSVWHMWTKYNNGEFAYYLVDTATTEFPTTGNVDGDYLINYNPTTYANDVYTWDDAEDEWTLVETIAATDMEDFGVIHINKGLYADRGLYWFATSWNVLDADMVDIENRLAALEAARFSAVTHPNDGVTYEMQVVDSYLEAEHISPETGKLKIILVQEN